MASSSSDIIRNEDIGLNSGHDQDLPSLHGESDMETGTLQPFIFPSEIWLEVLKYLD